MFLHSRLFSILHLPLFFRLFLYRSLFFFFFNDTATTEIYPLSPHDALPISSVARAEAPGAEVRPLHLVTGIEPPPGPGEPWRIAFKELDGGSDGTLEAPTLVLAAGTVGSS